MRLLIIADQDLYPAIHKTGVNYTHPQAKTFMDARKEKFGYGVTKFF